MKSKKQALIEVLDELINIFESHGDQHWSQWIREDAKDIRQGNLSGARHFLTAYGGMGSLNDRYLCKQNGDKITEAQTAPVNARLNRARSQAWSLARDVLSAEDDA